MPGYCWGVESDCTDAQGQAVCRDTGEGYWESGVWLTLTCGRSAPDEDHTLRSCILLGGLIGGYEAGFMIPPAGDDVKWRV